MECGLACARFLLILFNILFWLSGVVVLGVGIWLSVDKSILDIIDFVAIDESDPLLKYAAYVLIGVGAFIFVVGFVGCFGAFRTSKFLLGLYMFLLMLVMIGELTAGIMALVYQNRIENEFEDEWTEKVLTDNYANMTKDPVEYTAFGLSMNLIQWKFHCCGVNGVEDYTDNLTQHHWPKNDSGGEMRPFPFTCCVLKDEVDNPKEVQRSEVLDLDRCYAQGDNYMWKRGCHKGLMSWVQDHAATLGGLGIGIAFLEIFGFLFACCLCRAHAKENDY